MGMLNRTKVLIFASSVTIAIVAMVAINRPIAGAGGISEKVGASLGADTGLNDTGVFHPKKFAGPDANKGAYRRQGTYPLPGASLAENIANLDKVGRIERSAMAYAMAMELQNCTFLDSQYADLEASAKGGADSEQDVSAQMHRLDTTLRKCSGLSESQLNSRYSLLQEAAENGNVDAQVAYPAIFAQLLSVEKNALDPDFVRSYKERSMRYLISAAATGSVDAMTNLAFAYSNGLLAEVNKVNAYAYMYAAAQSGLLLVSPQPALDLLSADMSPQEISAAVIRGRDLYSRCCIE